MNTNTNTNNKGEKMEISNIKISVQYVTRYTKRDSKPYLKAIVRCATEDSEYRHDAEDFIETGLWGALDDENNQHLVKYRDRYEQKVLEYGYQFRNGFVESQ